MKPSNTDKKAEKALLEIIAKRHSFGLQDIKIEAQEKELPPYYRLLKVCCPERGADCVSACRHHSAREAFSVEDKSKNNVVGYQFYCEKQIDFHNPTGRYLGYYHMTGLPKAERLSRLDR